MIEATKAAVVAVAVPEGDGCDAEVTRQAERERERESERDRERETEREREAKPYTLPLLRTPTGRSRGFGEALERFLGHSVPRGVAAGGNDRGTGRR